MTTPENVNELIWHLEKMQGRRDLEGHELSILAQTISYLHNYLNLLATDAYSRRFFTRDNREVILQRPVVESERRRLRNYYVAIHMGLAPSSDADVDLGKKALDGLMRENETAISEEEKWQPTNF